MSYISSLTLSHFRCYEQGRLSDIAAGFVALYGRNGAGKTNVLEALSMLSPGRGLRGAKTGELQYIPPSFPPDNGGEVRGGDPWAVAAVLQTPYGEIKLGTGLDAANPGKRLVRIQGETVKAQSALADHLACVWLTPQMDRLFLDAAGQRRRFFDRLVFAFDPSHSGRINRFENAMRQRSKLLQSGKGEPAWLEGLEAQMAETGVAIAAARLDFVERLQAACDNARQSETPFPHAALSFAGTLEEQLAKIPALEVEALFKHQLAESRGVDMLTGGAATGPHKTDLNVMYTDKNMAADQCSTGEQKALLIGIVLAHARLMKAERGAAPLLLLDEVAAHLDEKRRGALYDLLDTLGGQVWLSGTDRNLFAALEGRGQFIRIESAQIHPEGLE